MINLPKWRCVEPGSWVADGPNGEHWWAGACHDGSWELVGGPAGTPYLGNYPTLRAAKIAAASVSAPEPE